MGEILGLRQRAAQEGGGEGRDRCSIPLSSWPQGISLGHAFRPVEVTVSRAPEEI